MSRGGAESWEWLQGRDGSCGEGLEMDPAPPL